MTGDVSPSDFEFVRRLVYDHSGLALDDGKEYLLQARLSPIVRREGLGSLAELVGRLRGRTATSTTNLCDDVVEAMSTNETSFFRDAHPFEALRRQIIPEVLEANRGGTLNVWSAAASTGQEPYSVAMLCCEHFPAAHVSILATDLSRQVLERAESGCFNQIEVNRGLPAGLLVKYFERQGLQWRVKDSLRRLITFRRLNLTRRFPPLPLMDVVLLRNVLIYLDVAARAVVLERVAEVMRPGGYLCLGTPETTYGLSSRYERVEVGKAMFYRLTKGTPVIR